MKKIVLVVCALALFQHWGTLQNWLQRQQADRPGEVVLYATQWCGYCAKTRELLNEQQVIYREVDIEHDPTGQAAFQALGGRGVPVLDVRGTIIHGYQPQAMRAAL